MNHHADAATRDVYKAHSLLASAESATAAAESALDVLEMLVICKDLNTPGTDAMDQNAFSVFMEGITAQVRHANEKIAGAIDILSDLQKTPLTAPND